MAGQARRSERKQHSPSHGCRALRGALWTASARRCCTRSVVLRCEVARWCQARLAGPAKQCVLGGAPTRCFSDCVFALSFRRWIPAGRRWASAAAHRYAGIEATRGHRAAELERIQKHMLCQKLSVGAQGVRVCSCSRKRRAALPAGTAARRQASRGLGTSNEAATWQRLASTLLRTLYISTSQASFQVFKSF